MSEIIIFNRTLTDDEHARMLAYCARQETTKQVICDGDSLTYGSPSYANSYGIPVQNGLSWPWQLSRIAGDGAGWRLTNYAYPGVGVTGSGSPTSRIGWLPSMYDATQFTTGNVYVLWIGSNDIVGGANATTEYANILSCHAAMRAAGFKTIAVSVIDRSDNTSAARIQRNALNAAMKAAGLSLCDAYVDLEATALGGDGAYSNATYYNASDSPLIHLTKAGYEVVARSVMTAIKRLEGQSINVVALTDGATITSACDPARPTQFASVTLGGNRTLAFTGAAAGMRGTILVKQDATGSRTLTLPTGSKVAGGGSGAVTLSTAANAVDRLSWEYDGTNYYWTVGTNYN